MSTCLACCRLDLHVCFIGGGFPDCFRIRFPFASFVHLVLGFLWVASYPWFPFEVEFGVGRSFAVGLWPHWLRLGKFAHDWQSDPCFLCFFTFDSQ